MKRRMLSDEEIEDIRDRISEHAWREACRKGDCGDLDARDSERLQKLHERQDLRKCPERDRED